MSDRPPLRSFATLDEALAEIPDVRDVSGAVGATAELS
jgi:hypothetical protein